MNVTYCNPSDLERVFADINSYDLKRDLPVNDFVTYSGSIVSLADSGVVSVLFEDGIDLGDPEDTLLDITKKSEWFYDSEDDMLYIWPSATITDERIQSAPQKWTDAKTQAIRDASEWLESVLDNRFPRPLPKITGSKSSRDYDWVIVQLTALNACILLIQATDPRSEVLRSIADQISNSDRTGLLDQLNAGKIRLFFEVTHSDQGEITEHSVDNTTTGYLTDLRGSASALAETYIVKITASGTLQNGTENTTVKYQVSDSQGNTVVNEALITGYYQNVGGALMARFVPGVYVADDEWRIFSEGVKSNTGTLNTVDLFR